MSEKENLELRSIRPSEHRPRPLEPVASDVAPIVRKFQFAAVDRGFGLDAEMMIERSQRLHAHHRGKALTPTSSEPVILNAAPSLGQLTKSTTMPSPITHPAAPIRHTVASQPPPVSSQQITASQASSKTIREQVDNTDPRLPSTVNSQPSTAAVGQAAPTRPPSPISTTSTHGIHFQPLPVPDATVPEQSVSSSRAFCAFVADVSIPLSILVSFVVTQGTWQSGLEQSLARLASRSNSWELIERAYLLFPWLFSLASACGLTFITQYFCGMLGHNSFGRSLCGMNLKKMHSISHVFLLALFEAITFGGLLTLPFLFLMPSRLPLFPWVQFRLR